MRIYISGPITGVPDYRRAFYNAEHALQDRGHQVQNPARHPFGLTRVDYMRLDLAQLMTCGAVYMLPGWEHSGGARIEHALAEYLELQIFHRLEDVPDATEPES